MTALTMNPDTSARASAVTVPPSQQMVLDVLIARARHNVDRMTAGEIREVLEQLHSPRRFDKGWVTGRLAELEDRGLVVQSDETRLNPLTGRTSALWFLPVHQARLCA